MTYKTICFQLLELHPPLYEQLRKSRLLLAMMEQLAGELKVSHQMWMDHLAQVRPESDTSQISSEAMELALQDIKDRLSAESSQDQSEPLSLEAAMEFIRHTPTA